MKQMLSNCCFCIDLRTATLILAVCGTISHFYSAFALNDVPTIDNDLVVFAISTYSWIAGFACLAGFVGVLRNNLTYLRIFSLYYWADLAIHFFFSVVFAVVAFSVGKDVCSEVVDSPEDPVDIDTCLGIYLATSTAVVIAMGFSLFLKLHYSLAIHAYYLTLKHHTQKLMASPENTLIPVFSYPTAYASVPQSEQAADSDDEEEGRSLPPAYSPAPGYPGIILLDGAKDGGVKL